MSAKNLDQNGRLRSKTIGFRVSEEESKAIDELVYLSGLTKQDYIIAKLLNKDVVITGNPRVFSRLRDKMDNIYTELQRLNNSGEATEQFWETLRVVCKLYDGLNK